MLSFLMVYYVPYLIDPLDPDPKIRITDQRIRIRHNISFNPKEFQRM